MDGPDWLRTQLASFDCPACGRRYRGSRIRLLAERDGLFFVDLDCPRCGSHTVAIVTVELDDSEPSIAEISDLGHSSAELAPTGSSTVTADDVLEMHQFLAGFRGDVAQLFRAATARSDGAERT
jgi:predicted RNA-binding Zn-ribbon protein involved in translation (DUF1610 family)